MSKTAVVQAQQRWEYTFFNRKSEQAVVNELNALGQEGWEAIDSHYYKDVKGTMTWTVYLKRPSTGAAPGPLPHASAAAQAASAGGEAPNQPKGFDLDGEVFEFQKEEPKGDAP